MDLLAALGWPQRWRASFGTLRWMRGDLSLGSSEVVWVAGIVKNEDGLRISSHRIAQDGADEVLLLATFTGTPESGYTVSSWGHQTDSLPSAAAVVVAFMEQLQDFDRPPVFIPRVSNSMHRIKLALDPVDQ